MDSYRILVVDDEEFMRKLCGRVLAGLGVEPLFAESVAVALEKAASLDGLDLLITDLRLPDGHGLEVARGVRKKFPAAGILVISAFLNLEENKESFLALGVTEDDMFSKPFSVTVLETAVKARLPGGEKGKAGAL
ncbi:MAG: hypothetical protein A2107_15825 [Verrucomicrobia bacterium GWF2_62_7]|nr:MAG: hypothetical protein A2X32_11385 [Elusimicrobia bacterium GWC2_64_44]OHE75361.1 MAG: hypothetical protein A2107_15825 [Verrucomicrobia bacterium GWF2_62_7]